MDYLGALLGAGATIMKSVETYYQDLIASPNGYSGQFYDQGGDHPDYRRLWPVMRRMVSRGVKSVYEVGCGDGFVLKLCKRAGIRPLGGCDITSVMLEKSNDLLKSDLLHLPLIVADLEDALSLAPALSILRVTPPDAVLCLGVMPHVVDDRQALQNLRMLGRVGTVYFIEIRNALFHLFTMNRYTVDFFRELIGNTPSWSRVENMLRARLQMSAPPPEPTRRRFHNPLTFVDLLKDAGFGAPTFHWYHAHAMPPWMIGLIGFDNEAKHHSTALALERTQDWRLTFLCSAAVVEVEAL